MASRPRRTRLNILGRLIGAAINLLLLVGLIWTILADGGLPLLLTQVALAALSLVLLVLLIPLALDWADRRFRRAAERRDGAVLNLTDD